MQEDNAHTHTHMLIGGDFNAQVGANDEPDATSDEREHSAIDSKYVRKKRILVPKTAGGQWLRHWAVQHQLVLANTHFKTQEYNQATYHSTKHCMPLDYVLMNRALFKHCKDAETKGHINMNSDRIVVIARIKLPIDHTQLTKGDAQRKYYKETRKNTMTVELIGVSAY